MGDIAQQEPRLEPGSRGPVGPQVPGVGEQAESPGIIGLLLHRTARDALGDAPPVQGIVVLGQPL